MSKSSEFNNRGNNHKVISKENGRVRVRTLNNEPSEARQEFKNECDINNILKKYADTGVLTHVRKTQGVYADFTSVEDYHTSLNKIINAENSFMELPAHIRERFNNDPAQLLGFTMNPENYDEGVKLGLFQERPSTPADIAKNDQTKTNDQGKKSAKKEQQLNLETKTKQIDPE